MLNQKSLCYQWLKALQIDKWHYDKWCNDISSRMIRYTMTQDTLYHHVEQNENKPWTKRSRARVQKLQVQKLRVCALAPKL
jgi:hypothetical protein